MEILMKKSKKIISFLLIVCLFGACVRIVLADQSKQTNPLEFMATAMSEQGEFIVSVKFKEGLTMKAYKFTIQYDSSKLELDAAKDNAYGYFPAFVKTYNNNGKGLIDSNHIISDSCLIFAGAQPQDAAALVQEQSRCAYVRFRLKSEDKSEEAYLQALEGLTLSVNNFSDGQQDLVETLPSLFETPLVAKTGDVLDDNDFEQRRLGDIDQDGNVSLDDARVILLYALAIEKIPEKDLPIADINHDLNVTLEDASMTLSAALGIITLQ